MMSSLTLANDDPLYLSDIFAELVIDSNRLVVLSACESGLSDLRGATEEFIGLPTGFLLAGANGVVSSLWKVEDAATSLLMSRFYEFHRGDRHSPQRALREAQKWLRSLTAQDLMNLGAAGRKLLTFYPNEILSQESNKICDYPFFWGGFTFVGA
jgi:CHAT domain-containing protein